MTDFGGSFLASFGHTSDEAVVYSDCVSTFCNSEKNFAYPPNPAEPPFSCFWGGGWGRGLGGHGPSIGHCRAQILQKPWAICPVQGHSYRRFWVYCLLVPSNDCLFICVSPNSKNEVSNKK